MKAEELERLYEKLYFHEVDTREYLSNRAQIPLLVLLALASAYSLIFKSLFSYSQFPCIWLFYAYIFVCVFSLVLLTTAAVYWSKALSGSEYHCLPKASETFHYRNSCIVYYEKECSEVTVEERLSYVDDAMKAYLIDSMVSCSSHNTEINDRRSKKLYSCNRFLLWSALSISVCLITHFYVQSKESPIELVRIVDESGKDQSFVRNLNMATLKIDFSDDVKRYLNEQKSVTGQTK